MKLKVKELSEYASLYRELAQVIAQNGKRAILDQWDEASEQPSPAQKLAGDLEQLGPTFVKLGQLLSTRSDLLPPEYLNAFERLQNDVAPMAYEDVCKQIEDELGGRPDEVFLEFDPTPLAAASLSQVHRAYLDADTPVVVKVQRRGARAQVRRELDVLHTVGSTLERHTEVARQYQLQAMIEELSGSLRRELDYEIEANNLSHMREQLRDYPGLVVPRHYPQLCTPRVLTMDYIDGRKLPESRSSTDSIESDRGSELADELMQAYLKQVLLTGIYHADPHPGNVLITGDGDLCLLDMGMVGHMPGSLQVMLARLLLAVAIDDGENAAEVALDASGRRERHNESRFRRQIVSMVAEHHSRPMDQIQAGRIIMDIVQVAGENGIIMPHEMTLLAKTILNLDEIARRLDPNFHPAEALRRHVPPLLAQRLAYDAHPTTFLDGYLEARELVKAGPRRLNNLLRKLENGRFTTRIDLVDEHHFLESMLKIANRITAGLIIAAMILGAALMFQLDTPGARIFGYPALALVFFVGAAAGGAGLLWRMFSSDRIPRRKERSEPPRRV